MSEKTIWEEASRLRRHPKVAARIIIELEVLGKHVGLFKPKEVPLVERPVEDISNQLQRRLEEL